MRLSYSQIEKFINYKWEWYWKYVLWNKEDNYSSAKVIGKACHLAVEHINRYGEIDREIVNKFVLWECMQKIDDSNLCYETNINDSLVVERAINNFVNHYYKNWIKKSSWQVEWLVKWELLWNEIIWYVDLLTEDCIIDYKFVASHTKMWSWFKSPFSPNLTNEQKYKIQWYIYMKLSWVKKVVFIETLKKDLTISPSWSWYRKSDLISLCKDFDPKDVKLTMPKIVEKYKPKKIWVKEIVIEMSEELEKEVLGIIEPAIEEMKEYTDNAEKRVLNTIDSYFDKIKKIQDKVMDEKDSTNMAKYISDVADLIFQMELKHSEMKSKYKSEYIKKKEN